MRETDIISRVFLQKLRNYALKMVPVNPNTDWARAYIKLADAADRLDAMHARDTEPSEPIAIPPNIPIEQLKQISNVPVWDGDLIGKSDRDRLFEMGLIDRAHGYNFLTAKGIKACLELRILKP
jgi:hypothetical protein